MQGGVVEAHAVEAGGHADGFPDPVEGSLEAGGFRGGDRGGSIGGVPSLECECVEHEGGDAGVGDEVDIAEVGGFFGGQVSKGRVLGYYQCVGCFWTGD